MPSFALANHGPVPISVCCEQAGYGVLLEENVYNSISCTFVAENILSSSATTAGEGARTGTSPGAVTTLRPIDAS